MFKYINFTGILTMIIEHYRKLSIKKKFLLLFSLYTLFWVIFAPTAIFKTNNYLLELRDSIVGMIGLRVKLEHVQGALFEQNSIVKRIFLRGENQQLFSFTSSRHLEKKEEIESELEEISKFNELLPYTKDYETFKNKLIRLYNVYDEAIKIYNEERDAELADNYLATAPVRLESVIESLVEIIDSVDRDIRIYKANTDAQGKMTILLITIAVIIMIIFFQIVIVIFVNRHIRRITSFTDFLKKKEENPDSDITYEDRFEGIEDEIHFLIKTFSTFNDIQSDFNSKLKQDVAKRTLKLRQELQIGEEKSNELERHEKILATFFESSTELMKLRNLKTIIEKSIDYLYGLYPRSSVGIIIDTGLKDGQYSEYSGRDFKEKQKEFLGKNFKELCTYPRERFIEEVSGVFEYVEPLTLYPIITGKEYTTVGCLAFYGDTPQGRELESIQIYLNILGTVTENVTLYNKFQKLGKAFEILKKKVEKKETKKTSW